MSYSEFPYSGEAAGSGSAPPAVDTTVVQPRRLGRSPEEAHFVPPRGRVTRIVTFGPDPVTAPGDIVQPRRFSSQAQDVSFLRIDGRTHRQSLYGDDVPDPPFRLIRRHNAWDRRSGEYLAQTSRVTRNAPVGPYPDCYGMRGRFVRDREVVDLLRVRVRRGKFWPQDEPTITFARRGRWSESTLPTDVMDGRASRTRQMGPDPDSTVPAIRRFVSQAMEIITWNQLLKRPLVINPTDTAPQPRRILVCQPLPVEGRIRRGRLYITGESYDPHECPSRPDYEDVSHSLPGRDEAEDALVAPDENTDSLPTFPDECR